jgi:gamma-glutamylcyclotransferase (GGCT)/AIG2-like uncharacterized protein YtfP
MVKLFVYGTLMPGQRAYALCEAEVCSVSPAIAKGQLYHLPLAYPAFVPGRKGLVHGVVLSFVNSDILARLDEYEQHDPKLFADFFPRQNIAESSYSRTIIQTTQGDAWSYTMTQNQIHHLQGALIPSGQWMSP